MTGVLIGFAVIAAVIVVGAVVGRLELLGEHARFALARLAFYVLTPCLLFTVLADAEMGVLFSALLPVSFIAAVVSFAAFALIARFVWRRALPETVVGALASGYVNANNIGIPVALYVLGDAAYSAPIVLLQLVVFAPIALTILDASTAGRVSAGRILSQPLRNPLMIASVLGVIVAVSGVELPEPVLEPFRLIGAAAVPVVLLAFGMSLAGQRVLQPRSGRRDVLLAAVLKLALMPAVAWAVGAFAFDLDPEPLFAVTVLAALPSAQNVFNYAQRYDRGETIARDAVLVTTIGSLGALLVVAAVLAP